MMKKIIATIQKFDFYDFIDHYGIILTMVLLISTVSALAFILGLVF
jgi:hypothetical protein